MSEDEEGVPITGFQIFVLSYLYSEELNQRSQSRIRKEGVHVNIRQLSLILPPSVISRDLTVAEMTTQLTVLVNLRFLERAMLNTSEEMFGSISITTDGILFVRKILGEFKNSVKDKKDFENKIDHIEGNSEAKRWFKGMWETFKEKSQDEIVDVILSQGKIYGPQLIGFLIRYLQTGQ